jgi:hypothetical protein
MANCNVEISMFYEKSAGDMTPCTCCNEPCISGKYTMWSQIGDAIYGFIEKSDLQLCQACFDALEEKPEVLQ